MWREWTWRKALLETVPPGRMSELPRSWTCSWTSTNHNDAFGWSERTRSAVTLIAE